MKNLTIQEEKALCSPFQILSVSEPQEDKKGNNFKSVSVVPIRPELLSLGFKLDEIVSGRKPINVAIFEEDGHWYDGVDKAKVLYGEDIKETTNFLFTVLDDNGEPFKFPESYGIKSLRGMPVVTNQIRTFRFEDQRRNPVIAKAMLRAKVTEIESAKLEVYKEYIELFLSSGKIEPSSSQEEVVLNP